ncbi:MULTISPECIES: hypothetical protein [unclassified Streptomyces]|uniref:hypothetical protein n=1 Tax=unclassified Streptomyces TaxID=2593676 RepID=UPI000B30AEBB|nr:hypothetical protein [Streptomyces sp. NRRL F-2747]
MTPEAAQQAAASAGQGLLMGTYGAEFGRYGIRVGHLRRGDGLGVTGPAAAASLPSLPPRGSKS